MRKTALAASQDETFNLAAHVPPHSSFTGERSGSRQFKQYSRCTLAEHLSKIVVQQKEEKRHENAKAFVCS